MTRTPHVQVRRVYEPPQAGDGQRVLVDRLWPRGLSKERARLDEWCKGIAHSTGLRELADPGPLTQLTAAKRSDISEATVLAGLLGKAAPR